mgnify:CR=1 FL=1
MNFKESWIKSFLGGISFSSLIILSLITFFILKEGIQIIFKVGVAKFIFSAEWAPLENKFGILPMLISTCIVTLLAVLLSLPIGLGTAIFLNEFANPKISTVIKPIIELLAAIPSVIYGFIGIQIISNLIRKYFGGSGLCVLNAAIVLSIMILPMLVSISSDALRNVPYQYKEASYAMGATKWQTIYHITLPAARSGILTALILATGRALGETMAVLMVIGNSTQIPKTLISPARTLTSGIALELGYAIGDHRRALFGCGVVLFALIMCLTLTLNLILRRKEKTKYLF